MTKHINGQAGKQGVTDLQRRIACLRKRIGELEECVKRRNDEIHELRVANAKLRELVKDMGELLDMLAGCDLDCKHYHRGCIGDCYYVNARRELGVEL